MTARGSRLAAILFADIVGYSDLAARDETLALKLLRVFESTARSSIPRYGGRVVKFLGDGVLAEFSSPRAAIGAAATLREEFGERAEESGLGEPALRVGIHVGDVTASEGDIVGDGVNTAARLHEVAEPGEILVSGTVHLQLRQRREIAFEPRGERELKGVGGHEVYAVSLVEPIEPVERDVADRREPAEREPIMSGRWARALVALLVVAVIGLGWYLLDGGNGAQAASRSIAVLPFETVGDVNPVFTEGIHGDVLTRLSGVSGLVVISRTSVRRFQEGETPLPEVARELGVRWILQGEVQQVGEKVQVNARLVNAREDRQVWAESYQRELSAANLFEIQGELTLQIVSSLKTQLTQREQRALERAPTEDLDAYRLYVHGRGLLEQRTEDGMRRAVEYFEQAVERDPDYALAWAGLADALTLLRDYGFSLPPGSLEPERAARRALELNPELAEAHASLGLLEYQERNAPAAIRHFLRAVELRPSYAEAYNWLGWVSQLLGRPQRALDYAKRSVELDPLGPEPIVNLSFSLLANGRAREALREARRAKEIQPDYSTGPFYEALALYHLGRFAEAAELLRGLSVPWSGSGPRSTLALIHLATGDTVRARAQADGAAEPYFEGLLHAGLGEEDEAFAAFERVRHWSHWPTLAIRYLFPEALGTLRDDPRYRALMREIDRYYGLEPDEKPVVTTPPREER